MDHDVDGDGVINLSTSQRPSAATTPNNIFQPINTEPVSEKIYLFLKCYLSGSLFIKHLYISPTMW